MSENTRVTRAATYVTVCVLAGAPIACSGLAPCEPCTGYTIQPKIENVAVDFWFKEPEAPYWTSCTQSAPPMPLLAYAEAQINVTFKCTGPSGTFELFFFGPNASDAASGLSDASVSWPILNATFRRSDGATFKGQFQESLDVATLVQHATGNRKLAAPYVTDDYERSIDVELREAQVSLWATDPPRREWVTMLLSFRFTASLSAKSVTVHRNACCGR